MFLLPKLSTPPPPLHLSNSNNSLQFPAPLFLTSQGTSVSSPKSATTSTKSKKESPENSNGSRNSPKKPQRSDFYLNIGSAVRVLRDDLPAIFDRDLNYEIYRDDVTFVDPLNTFHGIDNYKTIFWALRFHGRILFKEIGLDILRIWQPSETLILVRWELHGAPRVPWETQGSFGGTSRYKVDRSGRIYEHKVDNLALDFPRTVKAAASIADLVMAAPAPNLTFWDALGISERCSWKELYWKVVETVDLAEGRRQPDCSAAIEGKLVTC